MVQRRQWVRDSAEEACEVARGHGWLGEVDKFPKTRHALRAAPKIENLRRTPLHRTATGFVLFLHGNSTRPWLTVSSSVSRMKYDDASWHYGGEFPADLPQKAGGTHIAMFVTWCILNGMAGEIHQEDFPDLLEKLNKRELTPGEWFMTACDGKFTDEDLTKEGNQFTRKYFELKRGGYVADYEATVGTEPPTIYHVPDTWETYDTLAPVIGQRYQTWRKS